MRRASAGCGRPLAHSLTRPALMLLTWAVAAAFHKNRKTPAGGSTSCGAGAGAGSRSGWLARGLVTQSQSARWRHYNDNLSKLCLALLSTQKSQRRLCCLAALCNLHFSRGQLQLQIESQRQKLSLATRQKTRQQLSKRKRKPTDWTDLNGGPGINPWVQAVASYVPQIGIERALHRKGKGT